MTTLLDPNDARLATGAPPVLVPFNLAGVLAPADVHAAAAMCTLVGEDRPEVLLAAALAVRAPRYGHVCIELSSVADTVTGIDDAPVAVDDLAWIDPERWRTLLADSPLVRVRPAGTTIPDPDTDLPLTLVGDRLYLDRYWRYERRVAEALRRRAERTVDDVDVTTLRAAIDRLLPPGDEHPDRQRLAVATGMVRRLTVIAGGPGTGKTHTVARLLALLHEVSAGRVPRVAVAAPTGKAADRLTLAMRKAAADVDTTDDVREWLKALEASTLHRLLGWQPGTRTRFRHGLDRKLPHEVVVVDETSMVDLPLMAKLLMALRRDTRLVLVGDPDQLASVEAGAVLADIVGATGDALRMSTATRDTLAAATGEPLEDVSVTDAHGFDDAIVVLGRMRRFSPDSGIAALAAAIHAGLGDAAIAALQGPQSDLRWIDTLGDDAAAADLSPVRELVTGAFQAVLAAARAGDAAGALAAVDAVRVLCAHRNGPVGVTGWVPRIERWLAEDVQHFAPTGRWYVGQPVMITTNDRRLRLFNGDVGVVVRAGTGVQVAFAGPEGPRLFGPSRLEDTETVHAMTIHKSQGSQFTDVVVVLPDESSKILTRELLYTAVTRAEGSVTIVGPEASVRAAIARRVSRASGLRETLWDSP